MTQATAILIVVVGVMGNQSSNCDQVNNNNNSEMEQRQENEVNSTRTAEQPSEDNAAEVATQDVADEKATEQGRLPDSPKEELEEPIVEKKFVRSRNY